MKRALLLGAIGFGVGIVAIGTAWAWLALTETKLYDGLYHIGDI